LSRNAIYFLIGLLAAAVVVVGYMYYQESQEGVDIRIDESGVSIDGN
jgi:hypothetical protein